MPTDGPVTPPPARPDGPGTTGWATSSPTTTQPLPGVPGSSAPPAAGYGSQRPQARTPSGRPGWRSPLVLVPTALGSVLVLLFLATFAVGGPGKVFHHFFPPGPEDAPAGTPRATGAVGALPAGRTWLSGAWTGGGTSTERINAFAAWRGQPADTVTMYPAYETWDELKNSEWHVAQFDGFSGRLVYGLPLMVRQSKGEYLADVAAGKNDDTWNAIADTLAKHDRGNSFVRIGLEANGTWFPWGAKADYANDFVAAYRHVQGILKARLPELTFVFDLTCARGLEGSSQRLDALTKLYPGDDVVDVVGCDHYDSYSVKSRNSQEWQNTLHPQTGPGIGDVADFARAHRKKLAIPEWGLQRVQNDGAGDNPFFVYSMYSYFEQNKDILAFENYFNEPADSQGSGIWDKVQNPKSAAEYKKLWSAAPHRTTP